MNVICKARHFCLCSSDTDKTFLPKTSAAIWFSAQIWSKSPVTPLILKLQLSCAFLLHFFPAEWTQWTSCSASATRPKSYSRGSRLWGGRWVQTYPGFKIVPGGQPNAPVGRWPGGHSTVWAEQTRLWEPEEHQEPLWRDQVPKNLPWEAWGKGVEVGLKAKISFKTKV